MRNNNNSKRTTKMTKEKCKCTIISIITASRILEIGINEESKEMRKNDGEGPSSLILKITGQILAVQKRGKSKANKKIKLKAKQSHKIQRRSNYNNTTIMTERPHKKCKLHHPDVISQSRSY